MTWYAILGLIAAVLAGSGFAFAQHKKEAGDDYANEVAGYLLMMLAAWLGIIAVIGWFLS